MNMNVFVRCFIQDKEKIKNYGRREMFKDKETPKIYTYGNGERRKNWGKRDMASKFNLNLFTKLFHSKLYKPDIIEKSITRCFPILL